MKTGLRFRAAAASAVAAAALLSQTAAAAVARDAEINEENIMALLNEYDPDGAFVMQQSIDNGRDILEWFTGDIILDNIETAVHEETHMYIMREGRADREDIYIGGGNSIQVDYTEIYNSNQMAADVPEELRTMRFDTYVGSPVEHLASDVEGVYGLLNEFAAYCSGMHTSVSLYDYCKAEASDEKDMVSCLNLMENGRMAYSEFNYYILKYLEYAQKNYPDVYDGIMANDSFKQAYTAIEARYQGLVAQADQYREQIMQDYDAEMQNGRVNFASTIVNANVDDIQALNDEVSKPEYQQIYQELTAGGVLAQTTVTTTAQTTSRSGAPSGSTMTNTVIVRTEDDEDAGALEVFSNIVLYGLWGVFALGVLALLAECAESRPRKD